jgi:ankyrin repeat protein
MTPDEQSKLNNRLTNAATNGDTATVQTLLAAGADVHAENDWALCYTSANGHTETVKTLLANGANVHSGDDWALRVVARYGHTEMVLVLAKHIFAPDSWRGKSRAEIEAGATALYDKIKDDNPSPESLREAATILADCAIDCWHQVRPAPPKLQVSPLPAQPRPL